MLIENDLLKRKQKQKDIHPSPNSVLLHESCGHFEKEKTFQRTQEKSYWPGKSRDFEDWVNSSEKRISKKPSQKNKHPL